MERPAIIHHRSTVPRVGRARELAAVEKRTAGWPVAVTLYRNQRTHRGRGHDASADNARWPGVSALIDEACGLTGNDLIAATLGLTPTETQVALGLAEGKSVRDMADATGHTTAAIRWHLNQIYQKQSISRQVDLVRLVLSLAELG